MTLLNAIQPGARLLHGARPVVWVGPLSQGTSPTDYALVRDERGQAYPAHIGELTQPPPSDRALADRLRAAAAERPDAAGVLRECADALTNPNPQAA